MQRLIHFALVVLMAISAPAFADDSVALSAVDLTEDLPIVALMDVELKRRSFPDFPHELREWLRSEAAEHGAPQTISCRTLARYDADGHFVEVELTGCPDEVVTIVEPRVERAWRRSFLVERPEGCESGLWLLSTTTWTLK